MRTGGAGLVGRDGELALLAADLDAAAQGSARIVVVTGEAGIGKTRLCREVVARATGFRTLRAAGEQSESDLPYGVVDQLFADVLATPAADLGPTPLAVGAALVQVVSDQQSGGPLLLWVDDLHWADPPSQRALLFLLRRLEADTVAVMLCVRDGRDGWLLPGLVQHLASDACRRVPLAGLDAQDLAEIAGGAASDLSPTALRRLHEHTGGNPLWATALLQEQSLQRLTGGSGPLPAPRSFGALTKDRLAVLKPAAEALVSAAAVAGGEATLGLLADVAGVGEPFAALDEAVSAGLLVSDAGRPPMVRVLHSLIASAVSDQLGTDRRAALHLAFAARAANEHERLRHEVAASPGHDPALAARLAAAAADQAGRGSWLIAAHLFADAARLSADVDEQQTHLEQAMAAALTGGDTERAVALGDRLTGFRQSPRRLSLAGWLAISRGRYDEAEALLRRAVETGEAAEDLSVVAEASRMLCHLLMIVGRAADGVVYGGRAVEIEPAGSIQAGMARGNLAVALTTLGEHDAASRLTEGIDAGRLRPDELFPLVARGVNRVTRGEFDGAVRDLQAVMAVSRAVGAFEFLCVASSQLSDALFQRGDWDAAVDSSERAVRIAEDAQQTWALSPVHAHASFVPARRGNWAVAARHVETASAAAARTRECMSVAYAAAAGALLAHSRGQFDRVLSSISPILALEHRSGPDQPGILEWQPLYAEALVRTGRLETAEDFLATFLDSCEDAGITWTVGAARRVRGLILDAKGDLPGAVCEFEAAHALLEKAGTVFQAALADLHHGQVLRRAGVRRDATTLLVRALDVMTRLGAVPFVDLARRELSAIGVEPKAPSAGPTSGALTAQELTVARLVSKGLTNREIGAELFISTKTVEYHLGNSYRKLGVTSRTQLLRHLAGE